MQGLISVAVAGVPGAGRADQGEAPRGATGVRPWWKDDAGPLGGWIGGSNGGQEGPASQGLAQAVQDRQAVLLDGRDVPADAAEVRSGMLAAERAEPLPLRSL